MRKKLLFLFFLVSFFVKGYTQSECGVSNTIVSEGTHTADNTNGDHWFQFTPSLSGIYSFSTQGMTSEDTYVEIYSQCGSSRISYNDDALGNSQSYLEIYLTANQTYYINWDSRYTDSIYNWELNFIEAVEGNIICNNSLIISEGIHTANNTNGNQWFQFTPTVSSIYTFSTQGMTSEDTYVEIYSDCGGTRIDFNDDYYNFNSLVNRQTYLEIDLIAGQTYYIRWRNEFTSSIYNWELRLGAIQIGEQIIYTTDHISDVNLQVGFGSHTINLNNYFASSIEDAVINYDYSILTNSLVSLDIHNGDLVISELSNVTGTVEVEVFAWVGEEEVIQSFVITILGDVSTNQLHVVANPISNQTFRQGFDYHTINISNVFTDTENDYLTYSISSNNQYVVSAYLGESASEIIIVEEDIPGTSIVTLTATDGYGRDVSSTFTVTVSENRPPLITNFPSSITLYEGFGTHTLNLNSIFTDPDGDEIDFEVASYEGVISVSLSETNILTIEEDQLGVDYVEVYYTDGYNEYVLDFIVNVLAVGNNLPEVNYLNLINITENPVAIDLTNYFTDPDGDNLTFELLSEDYLDFTGIVGNILNVNMPSIENIGNIIELDIVAEDGRGGVVFSRFVINLLNENNTVPSVIGNTRNINLTLNNNEAIIVLSQLFSDADGDDLDFDIDFDNYNVVQYYFGDDTLFIEGVSFGTTHVILYAMDYNGGITPVEFTITYQRAIVEIDELSSKHKTAKVYPTVPKSLINIECEVGSSIEIYTSEGKRLYKGVAKSTKNEVNLGDFNASIYYVKVGNKVFNIVKQ
jgi:hypothetical protein